MVFLDLVQKCTDREESLYVYEIKTTVWSTVTTIFFSSSLVCIDLMPECNPLMKRTAERHACIMINDIRRLFRPSKERMDRVERLLIWKPRFAWRDIRRLKIKRRKCVIYYFDHTKDGVKTRKWFKGQYRKLNPGLRFLQIQVNGFLCYWTNRLFKIKFNFQNKNVPC